MATRTSPFLMLLTFLLHSSSVLPNPSLSSDPNSFVFVGCTQQKYSQDSPYEYNVDSLLTSLVNSAAYSSYNNYTIMGSSPQDVIYGLYQCRGDLSMPDCAICIARAVSQLGSLCSHTCGGAVQLQGCYVKYDNTPFLGVEDKTVVLKKCGPSIGYDTDAMSVRDAVLSGLDRAGGLYRVGGSGEIQGLAQCLGDLSIGQCQDCLSEAIGRLKTDCGQAVYGDMFLDKCYARYSTGGAHASYKTHNDQCTNGGEKKSADKCTNGGEKKSADKCTNGVEKKLRIIIGLAGATLLVGFLTFIRKIFGENVKIVTPPNRENPISLGKVELVICPPTHKNMCKHMAASM